jgi:hypothetical protein
MKPRLTRQQKGLSWPRLLSIELNNFDIERVLPDVLYLVVSHGRQRGSTPNDARAVGRYSEKLAKHHAMSGFDDEADRTLLDHWIRAAAISTSRATKGRTAEQIDFLRPLTLAVYKTGFPEVRSRQRNIPGFLYAAMLDAVVGDDRLKASSRLLAIFSDALGRGVRVGPAPDYEPTYDGSTQLDLHARLQLAYLDGFDPVLASVRAPREEYSAALPAQAAGAGRRLLAFVEFYAAVNPAPALARGLLALSNLELFAYTLKLFAAAPSLVGTGELPPAMRNESPSGPEVYCDFTGVRGGTSDELARACVDRDLQSLNAYYDAVIWLRSVDRLVRRTALASDLDNIGADTPTYLHTLRAFAKELRVQQWAEIEFEQIRDDTLAAATAESRVSVESQFEAQSRVASDALTATIGLIADAQRGVYLTNLGKWYGNAGGIRLQYGLLAGNVAGRRNWRYSLSDELLLVLVQLAFADRLGAKPPGSRLPLREFLTYLENNYGLIVDRPPEFLDTTMARAGSRDNLAAFKRKLRQMGFFDELSDDFSAQYLSMPGSAA